MKLNKYPSQFNQAEAGLTGLGKNTHKHWVVVNLFYLVNPVYTRFILLTYLHSNEGLQLPELACRAR